MALTEPSTPSFLPERTSPIGLEAHISGTTLISGDGPAWKDVFVQVFSRNRVQQPFLVPAVVEPLIVWVMSGSATVEERDLGGEWQASRVSVGDFFLTRSPVPYEMRWQADGDRPFQVMHLYVSIPLFEKVVREMQGKAYGNVTLRDVSGDRDTTISHVLSLLHGELVAEGGGSALFVEGLAQSLTVHLVRHYGIADTEARAQNALPGSKLRRAIAFMAARLDQPFDLDRLAREVGMSEFHFSRLFKTSTGVPPSLYFIRRRVAKAQKLLQETDTPIIEIGMTVGYSSPSHFAQIFRRETGLSPTDYRRGRGNSSLPTAN
ncbi:helix-turn-helix domain-containing protein [Methylocella tundrae]|uniref:AraC family transcriptional regulator n=1 Tax=Methylocella tundrae TaxID=227605 RepID=A0A4U8YYD3_METTU|nr:AraC family transcriptional regulator [Methylocella tundrae]WPP05914.1 AraC family transcriptional regulator [Methylocella tundrae]VFU08459.1 AraC family transcriptional regulator [Methylocella tundrae]